MYKKIISKHDKKHFGTKTIIYKGDENYFIIIDGRDRKDYFFVDLELTNLYPVDTYMRNIHYEYEANDDCDEMNIHFDIPLSKYGYSPCPQWIKSLLEGN